MKINCESCLKEIILTKEKGKTPTAYYCDYCGCSFPLDANTIPLNLEAAPGFKGNPLDPQLKMGDRRR